MGTEARLEDTDRAAWSALKEWLAKDRAGQVLLSQLLAHPEAAARALVDRLRGADAPALAATCLAEVTFATRGTTPGAEWTGSAGPSWHLPRPRDRRTPSAIP